MIRNYNMFMNSYFSGLLPKDIFILIFNLLLLNCILKILNIYTQINRISKCPFSCILIIYWFLTFIIFAIISDKNDINSCFYFFSKLAVKLKCLLSTWISLFSAVCFYLLFIFHCIALLLCFRTILLERL